MPVKVYVVEEDAYWDDSAQVWGVYSTLDLAIARIDSLTATPGHLARSRFTVYEWELDANPGERWAAADVPEVHTRRPREPSRVR